MVPTILSDGAEPNAVALEHALFDVTAKWTQSAEPRTASFGKYGIGTTRTTSDGIEAIAVIFPRTVCCGDGHFVESK